MQVWHQFYLIIEVMNTILESEILSQKSVSYIASVKMHVDEIYNNHQIFGLSLETLELTRRFYNLCAPLDKLAQMEIYELNHLMSISQHLERNLVQESV